MLNPLALGVGLLALARAGTAAVAMSRFGLTWFGAAFAVEAVVLGLAALALARSPSTGRRSAAAAFAATAIVQTVPFGLGLGRGVSFLTLGDVLFMGGLLGAAGATLAASTAKRRSLPAPAVAAHLAVAACGPLLWTLTNASMGRLDFAFTSAVGLAGAVLAARAFARGSEAETAAAPGIGA